MSAEGTLITMLGDFYPYCRGDVVRVTDAELKGMNKRAKTQGDGVKLYEQYSAPHDEGGLDDDGPSQKELRDRAKELGLSAGGSKEELQARIAAKEAEDGGGEGDEE